MKEFLYNVFKKIGDVVVTMLLFLFGFITVPFTILFNWKGFWILWIANEESCSLSEAKKLLNKEKKYKLRYLSDSEFDSHSTTNHNNDIMLSSMYNNVPGNIYYQKRDY